VVDKDSLDLKSEYLRESRRGFNSRDAIRELDSETEKNQAFKSRAQAIKLKHIIFRLISNKK